MAEGCVLQAFGGIGVDVEPINEFEMRDVRNATLEARRRFFAE